MDKDRLAYLKTILNQDFTKRHDIPQLNFTHSDLHWLVEQAEKVEVATANKDGAISLLDESIKTSSGLADKVLRYEEALEEIIRFDKMMYSPTEMRNFAMNALSNNYQYKFK